MIFVTWFPMVRSEISPWTGTSPSQHTHTQNARTIVLVIRQSDRTGFRRNGVQGMKGRGDAQPLVRPNLVLISFGGEWTMMNQPTAFIDNE